MHPSSKEAESFAKEHRNARRSFEEQKDSLHLRESIVSRTQEEYRQVLSSNLEIVERFKDMGQAHGSSAILDDRIHQIIGEADAEIEGALEDITQERRKIEQKMDDEEREFKRKTTSLSSR